MHHRNADCRSPPPTSIGRGHFVHHQRLQIPSDFQSAPRTSGQRPEQHVPRRLNVERRTTPCGGLSGCCIGGIAAATPAGTEARRCRGVRDETAIRLKVRKPAACRLPRGAGPKSANSESQGISSWFEMRFCGREGKRSQFPAQNSRRVRHRLQNPFKRARAIGMESH